MTEERALLFQKNLYLISTLLILELSLGNAWAVNVAGQVCDNCINYDAAVQEAITQAPGLDCGDPFNGPLECTSTPKNIVLVNLADEAIYPFRVIRDSTQPFAIHVEDLAISSDKYNNFINAAHAINAIQAGVDEIYANWDPYTGRFIGSNLNQTQSDKTGSTRVDIPGHCPAGTALEALTNDAVMNELINSARGFVESQLASIANNGSITNGNVSFGIGPARVTIYSGGNPSSLVPDSARFDFFRTEDGDGSFDRIVYSLDVFLSTRAVTFNLELGASIVNGMTATFYLSRTNITNECALARLANLPQTRPGGEIQFGGLPVDTSDGFPDGGAGGVGGGTPEFCTYDFYQNGGYEFSFNAPCME